MSWPYDVSFDPAGSVYVADGGNHRVQVFSQNGTYLRTLILVCMAVVQVNCLAQGVIHSGFLSVAVGCIGETWSVTQHTADTVGSKPKR